MRFRSIYTEARRRGWERGRAERMAGCEPSDSPLSGEWAGESINELMGDLIAQVKGEDEGESVSELCDEYEAGYFDAFEEQQA